MYLAPDKDNEPKRAVVRRRAWWIGGIALAAFAVVLGGTTLWHLALRDTAEPVTVADALRRFREQAVQSGTPMPPGVYVYRTRGYESVSALGGRRHRYPLRSTITVSRAACGAMLRWDVLKTRSNTWTVCDDGRGMWLDAWREGHVFFGREDSTSWRCTGTAWLPPVRGRGAVTPWNCRSSDTVQSGTLTLVGRETLSVDGAAVRALRLRAEVTESGEAKGPLVEERWLEPETGLPLRLRYLVRTDNPSLIGNVVFEERYELLLTSLEPHR